MKLDFTPRRLLAPNTPEEAAKLNQEIEKLVGLYQKVDKLSAQQARSLAESQAKAGNLNNEIKRLEKNLDDLIFASDYLYRSFQEQTAELRNQNVLLKIGKAAFNDLTNQAQKLFNFQQGYSDLQEKDFKKIQSSLKIQGNEISKIIDDLGKNEDYRKEEIRRLASIQESGEKLTKTEKERLNTLLKEQGLYEAAKDAQEGGLKLLEKEYQISKQIYKVKQDLGGLASAAAAVVSKYGGSLAQFLDVSEATEAVNEYNKQVIDNALKQEDVVKRLQQVETEKVAIQQSVLDAAKAVRDAQRELNLAKEVENELSALGIEQTRKDNELTIIGNSLREKREELERLQNDTSDAGNARRSQAQAELAELETQHTALKEEGEDISKRILSNESKRKDVKSLEIDLEQKSNNLRNEELSIDDRIAAKEQEAYDIKQKAIAATNSGLTGFINKFKSLGVLTSNLAGGLKKVFTDPVTLITTLVEIGLKANAQTVELGKSFGVSADEAGKIRQEVTAFARGTGDTFINTDRLLKAQSELSKELGIAVKFSNEELATFAKLTELTGLSAQEAGKLALASKAAGMPTENYTDSIREAAFFAQQATGTHFDSKEILQDVSKLSAGILVKFQGNPKAIGQAVVEAKKLGATLDQIDKIGESLLNFESSIENELKAELMTGKQLNLERARAAALAGDQLTLTREISSQVGSLNDFQNMNVLAQKSLAEAFGLSRDEMAEMLMKQEAINKYGKEAADLNKDQLQALKDSGLSASEFLKKQEQQRTAQAKFQDAITKLQTIIANLVDGPVGKLLDAFANLVTVVMKIFNNPIVNGFFTVISKIAEVLANIFSMDWAGWVLGIGAAAMFLPKMLGGIAGGLGSAYKGLTGLGKGMLSVFKKDTWQSFGKGIGSIFKKDTYTDFFKTLKSKFLESAGLSEKLKESVGGTVVDKTKEAAVGTVTETVADKTKEAAAGVTEKVVEAGEESLGDKLKDKATETVEGKVEDKAGELQEKVMGGAEEAGAETEKIEGGSDGSKFRDKMKNVAEGIKAFGDGKVILGGLIGLPASAVGLIAMLPGVLGIKAIERVNGEKFQENMYGIAYGIEAFGNLRVTGGALNLIAASAGLIAMIPGVVGAKLIEFINGPKLNKSLTGLATGLSLMGDTKVLLGAGALALAAPGLLLAAPGLLLLQLVNGTAIKSALTGLGQGLKSLGSAIAKPQVLLGLGALTLALMGIGKALQYTAPAIEAFGSAIKSVFEGLASVISAAAIGISTIFSSLQSVDVVKLLTIGPALIGIGAGLASIGAGNVINSISSFFAGDPAEKLERLASTGDGLQKTATALQNIAGALSGISVALNNIDASKLEALDEFASNRSSEGIVGSIASLITAPIKAAGEAITGGGENEEKINTSIDLTPMINAIREVKASVDKLYGKETSINMDGKKVGTTLVQSSYKLA